MSKKPTPKPPTWLDTTAKKYWKALSPSVDLNNESLKEQLAMLCDNWSVFREATSILQAEGIQQINDMGISKPHQMLSTKWKSQHEIQKLSKMLGVNEDVILEEDELDEFI